LLSSELYVIAESRVADPVVTEVVAIVEALGRWIAVERMGRQLHARFHPLFLFRYSNEIDRLTWACA
jgi:hypothetical protein